nr:MAG TPA: hypothetical protein [Caudoviricetes sp.]
MSRRVRARRPFIFAEKTCLERPMPCAMSHCLTPTSLASFLIRFT